MVQEAEVFQWAAGYFKAYPELTVTAANWTTFTGDDGTRGTPSCYP
jgi:hypothetical protein